MKKDAAGKETNRKKRGGEKRWRKWPEKLLKLGQVNVCGGGETFPVSSKDWGSKGVCTRDSQRYSQAGGYGKIAKGVRWGAGLFRRCRVDWPEKDGSVMGADQLKIAR